MAARGRRLAAALALALALASLVVVPPGVGLARDAAGTIEGRLVNGSAGGGQPADAEVVLHAFRNSAHDRDVPIRSSADGSFAFSGLDTDPGYSYEVTASYGGATYGGAPLTFGTGQRAQRLEITVYEPTATDPGVRVRRASLILARPDPSSQTLQAIEAQTLENPSDRTFVPNATGPAGPMGLVRFPLPPQAGSLQLGPGLDGAEIVQVDRGFATSMPLPPGTTDVVFAYRFPYVGGQPLAWERRTPYPTAELRVLQASDGPLLESPDLQETAPVQLDGRDYRHYLARDLAAGGKVGLTLRGLPGRWPFNLALDGVPATAWGALGASLALALALGFAVRAGRLSGAGSARADAADALALALASLDDAYAAGRLPAADYRVRRAELVAQLAQRLRSHGALRHPAPRGPLASGMLAEQSRREAHPEVASA